MQTTGTQHLSARAHGGLRRLVLLTGIVLGVLLCSALAAARASAATYTAAAGDGSTTACPDPTTGTCTLRQLVLYENGLPSTPNPPDTIQVPSGTDDLTNGAIDITRSVNIVGVSPATTTINQSSQTLDRVFVITRLRAQPQPAVTISGLTIVFGTAPTDTAGGDILNQGGDLGLSDDQIENGSTSGSIGAGIANVNGMLTINVLAGREQLCEHLSVDAYRRRRRWCCELGRQRGPERRQLDYFQ